VKSDKFRKTKVTCSLSCGREHVSNSGTVGGSKEEEGEEKRMIVNNIEMHCIYVGRKHNKMH
jgi:hypothetical protein